MPFQILWQNSSGDPIQPTWNPGVWFPISFQGASSKPITVQFRSNARDLQTYENLSNVKLYLTGDPDDINTIQNTWPTYGGSTRPEINGGFDVSFDFGRTWRRFDSNTGVASNSSTWVTLPVEAIGAQGLEGMLGSFDTATLMIRLVVPPVADQFRVLVVKLAVDCDVI